MRAVEDGRGMSDREAYICAALRTPVGKHGGSLASVRADDLAAIPIKALVERTGVDPRTIDDVILGCTNQAGEDNRNVARMALLLAGLPVEVPGQTVNRLCGSGLQAAASAAQAIKAGEGEIFIGLAVHEPAAKEGMDDLLGRDCRGGWGAVQDQSCGAGRVCRGEPAAGRAGTENVRVHG